MSQPHDEAPEPQDDTARYSLVLRSIGPNKTAVVELTRMVLEMHLGFRDTERLVESLGVLTSGLTLLEAKALAECYGEDGAICEIQRD